MLTLKFQLRRRAYGWNRLVLAKSCCTLWETSYICSSNMVDSVSI